ncbi:MAG: acyl-CoA synthetase [Burkholderiales bacterium]|nr:acyl-CoA synthetase [Burkholderiales bacterium]
MAAHPLVQNYAPDAAFAYRDGRCISVDQFLRDVTHLAALLPERRHILNLCDDRYRFAVGFSAALLRNQISLLPPNHTPDLIEQLSSRYAAVYCLTDRASPPPSVETVFYPPPGDAGRQAAPVPGIPTDQTAAFVFTSGSTGQPVANKKTWGALVSSARAEAKRLNMSARLGLTIVATVPAQHMYGLESTVLLAMQNGLALHAQRPFYPADISAALASLSRPRGLVTTPVHLRVLLAETINLPPLDFLLCATAPLPPQLAADAEARFAVPLHEIYGCTEAGQVATRRTAKTAHWRLFQGITLRQDKKGTWVSGGHVETEVLLSDVIEVTGRDTFLLHGRTADMINIAGKRTSLAHLNYHLNSIDGVRDGVFVMPHDEGETVTRLMAFVVAPSLSHAAVINALRQRIDAIFLPRPLCLVDALPRNATGKLPQQALQRLMSERSARRD